MRLIRAVRYADELQLVAPSLDVWLLHLPGLGNVRVRVEGFRV